jgi:nitronate monooxygenase
MTMGTDNTCWLSQFSLAEHYHVGRGFITWALREQPELLSHVLTQSPKAIFLSFGNPSMFVEEIKKKISP